MAYFARVYYPADSDGDVSFAVPFQYIQEGHVKVYHKLSSESLYLSTYTQGVDYSWTSASTITLTAPRDSITDILIKRETPMGVLAQQQAGVMSSAKLNLNMKQRQFVDEELYDATADTRVGIAALESRMAALEALVGAGEGAYVASLSEDIAAGSFVNLFYSSGLRMRKAIANDPNKWAHGFVSVGGTAGQPLPLQSSGINGLVNPPSFGEVFLSDAVPGGYTYALPSADGSTIQLLGTAVPGRGILFTPQQRITL